MGSELRYVWLTVAIALVFSLTTLRLYSHHGISFITGIGSGPCSCVSFNCTIPPVRSIPALSQDDAWTFSTERDANDYSLTLDQCDAAFPGLFTEIDNRVAARRSNPITEEELSRQHWPDGTIRYMIYDGQLYVIDTFRPDIRRSRQFSVPLAMTRALLSSREKVPNIEFLVSIEDFTTDPATPVWAFDRLYDQTSTWLIPDFGFFGWPEPGVGAYAEVRKRMEDVESAWPRFSAKEPKLFWRGAVEEAIAPELRQHLVDEAKGQPWADVEVLNWKAQGDADKHRVDIWDHCKYQYLVNTEGRAWSGRLKYIQNCQSVIVTHKLEWIVPHEYLMISEGEDQNFVQVERDFSDLKTKMDYLVAHPEEAERIADNNARVFRDRYLTPAAEACYWRKLFQGWSEVSYEPRFYDGEGPDRKWRGVPFDSYVLMRQLHWDPT